MLQQFVTMSNRTSHFRGGVCSGYFTSTQSIVVSHTIRRNFSTTRLRDRRGKIERLKKSLFLPCLILLRERGPT